MKIRLIIFLGLGRVIVNSDEFRQMQNHLERVINGNVIVGFDVFPQLRKLGLNKIRYMDLSSLGKIEPRTYSSPDIDAGDIMKFAVGLLC
jgi:hypothetical protein